MTCGNLLARQVGRATVSTRGLGALKDPESTKQSSTCLTGPSPLSHPSDTGCRSTSAGRTRSMPALRLCPCAGDTCASCLRASQIRMQPLDTAFCAVEMLHVHHLFLGSTFSPQHPLSVSSTAMHAAAAPADSNAVNSLC